MKILPFCLLVCLLPVCLSKNKITTPAPTPPPSIKPRYDHFVWQHIRPIQDNFEGCDEEMKNPIFPRNPCKKKNTFIFATTKKVTSICKDDGIYDEKSGFTRSKEVFQIAVCSEGKERCKYTEKQHNQRLIFVSCDGGFPVVINFKHLFFVHLDNPNYISHKSLK
uniref:Ribonuclease A-domain domain-containing protein n=1 Tax=Fundulus heteroclitus TaxID=8078 RepID=A0A3Q2QHV4_FUNHE